MLLRSTPLLCTVILSFVSFISPVLSLGSECNAPLGGGSASPSDPYWMETIPHRGISPITSSGYQVFRNVKDYGATGDGVTDDTAAIIRAMSSGGRCGEGTCASSTTTPAIVYFPRGTYLVSAPIPVYYYTQMIGDAKHRPTLLAAASFAGFAVLDADPYIPGGGGAQWYTNQNNFFRSIRNFVIDVTRVPPTNNQGTGIHWQVAQATSLMNIHFEMSTASNTAHQGIWMENGSGGFMGDLTFNGGAFGMWVGNQQFTSRNLTFTNIKTAVYMNWNWGWSFQNINIDNCGIGFEMNIGGTTQETQGAGGLNLMDITVSDTPVFVQTTKDTPSSLTGSIVINNARLRNVQDAVKVAGGRTVLAGGSKTIESWGQGNVYKGTNGDGAFTQGNIASATRASSLLDGSGKIFGKMHPQYENYAVSEFISVREQGAAGDGSTDDSRVIQEVFDKYAGCRIIFFDAGIYAVESTITIPADIQIVGEAWSIIAGKGSRFDDPNSPQVVVKAGEKGSSGKMEINDIIFSTIGPAAGAIVLEWNIKGSSQGNAGMWDSHVRTGGADGTNLQVSQCPTTAVGRRECFSAFLGLHLTRDSSGYFEGTWVWNADHNIDGDGVTQISIYSGRGLWSESQGPVWLVGTGSEHHVLYQYFLDGAKDHFLEMIQTETPYFQPSPPAPDPFVLDPKFNDPDVLDGVSWGLKVSDSSNIVVLGAGLYSFFDFYTQECLLTWDCQQQILDLDNNSSIWIYGLHTVGTTFQVSVNHGGVINQARNRNGFASTVTSWSRS